MTAVVLAGGGLANSLIAWRLRELRPEVPVVMVEQGATIGGNHTWSFHGDDLTPDQLAWINPLIAHSWAGQTVCFPEYSRRLRTPYHSVTSARLHERLVQALGDGIRLRSEISEVRADGVRLGSGEFLGASLVIDGRGRPDTAMFDLRWQKFLGMEVDLRNTHELDAPVLMDATVAQRDGYRFLYVLPLGPRRLLIEDTCYSDTPELRPEHLRGEVRRYAAARGWEIESVAREETGVLPIVLNGDVRAFWDGAGIAVPRAGIQAMLFHHTTGYSLPDAVRVADMVATAQDLVSGAIATSIHDFALRRWHEQRFFRLLNRLMFEAAEPEHRYLTLQHFYRLPEKIIGRFYAGHIRLIDQLRLLSGRPPVPVGRALRCLARSMMGRPAARGVVHGRSA